MSLPLAGKHMARLTSIFLGLVLTLGLFAQGIALPADSSVGAPDAAIIAPAGKTQIAPGQPVEDKHVFGVLPNYRTAESTVPFERLTVKQKFTIATKDSFDYPVLGTTAFFAGASQLQGADNSLYGQGVKGFAHRFGIGYADQIVGNYFPEAIVPTLFHEDPRYFRKGTGSVKGRLGYAVSRIFVCRTDSGAVRFNAPELVGNSLAALATRAYHPHERTAGDTLTQFGMYVGTDAIGQVAKEFWPDVKRWYQRRHNNESALLTVGKP